MSRKRGVKKSSSNGVPLDFRYGANWEQISREARYQCENCCYCIVKGATLTHHVRYVNPETNELLLDNVEIGKDIYPLCDACHRKVHSFKNYIIKGDDQKQFNHNTTKVIKRLDLGFKVISRKDKTA